MTEINPEAFNSLRQEEGFNFNKFIEESNQSKLLKLNNNNINKKKLIKPLNKNNSGY